LGLVPFREGNKWGYSDLSGKMIIAPQFDRTYFFSGDSVARVRQNNLYGFINTKGRVVIKPQFTSATDFYFGVSSVEKANKKYCIGLEGKDEECLALEEESVQEPDEQNYFQIEKDSAGYALIFTTTQDTVKESFDTVSVIGRYLFPKFSYFALVRKGGKYGAYNEQGVAIAPVSFDKLEILDMDSYKAVQNGKWGVKYFNGDTGVPFEYDSITKVNRFEEEQMKRLDQFIVSRDKKFGVVDNNGKVIVPLFYEEIQTPKQCSCPIEYVVRSKDFYGLFDSSGTQIIPFKYKGIDPFYSSSITHVLSAAGKEGYINRNGLEYFKD
jgi:hypothetical protein